MASSLECLVINTNSLNNFLQALQHSFFPSQLIISFPTMALSPLSGQNPYSTTKINYQHYQLLYQNILSMLTNLYHRQSQPSNFSPAATHSEQFNVTRKNIIMGWHYNHTSTLNLFTNLLSFLLFPKHFFSPQDHYSPQGSRQKVIK